MAKHKEKEENKKQEKAAKVVKQSELSKDEQILQINIGNQAQEQVFADPTYDATFKMLFYVIKLHIMQFFHQIHSLLLEISFIFFITNF
jgi:hypothetical protein